MVRYFVVPQKEEAFYSLIARFKNHLNLSGWGLNNILFGKKQISHNAIIPNNLRNFCELVGNNFSLPYQMIHDNHTILPLLKKYNRKLIDTENTKEPMSFFNNLLSKQKLKYCPVCFDENTSTIGEPYWNRLHNIPFIQICLNHKISLSSWTPNALSSIGNEIIAASDVTYTSNYRLLDNDVACLLTSQTVDCLFNDVKPELNKLVESAKEAGLLKQTAARVKLSDRHEVSLNNYIRMATIQNDHDTIEISKNIRSMLYGTKKNIDPYSFSILLGYLKDCTKLPVSPGFSQRIVNKKLLKKHRNTWVHELNSKNFISLTLSLKKLSGEYSWLTKNDPEWIHQVNKQKRLRKFSRSKQKLTIIKTDLQIVDELMSKKQELIECSLPRQISKNLILKLPEFKLLTRINLESFPKASEFIRENLETKFEFRMRSITKFLIDNKFKLPLRSLVQAKFNMLRASSTVEKKQLQDLLDQFY